MKEPKIGKWKLNNYVKVIGMVGGLVLAGFGWHWVDEYSNGYLAVCALGLAITGVCGYWAAKDKSTINDTPKKGSA